MLVQLEERLRRYGDTLERAITTQSPPVPTTPRAITVVRWRRLAAAVAAAIVVVVIAVVVAIAVPSSDDQEAGRRDQPRHVPSLGIDQLWPGPELTGVDRSSPVATAAAFVEDVTGETATQVVPDPRAQAASPTRVDVQLANGTSFPVLTSPVGDDWIVLQAGVGPLAMDARLSVLAYDPSTSGSRADIAWRDDEGTHAERVSEPDVGDGRAPIPIVGSVTSAVLTFRNELGAVAGVLGAYLEGPASGDTPEAALRSRVRVLVFNAGPPAGTAQNESNLLRTLGYNTLPAENLPVRTGTAVQCRPGFEDAANLLSRDVSTASQVEPFVEPSFPSSVENADCVVYMGTP